MAQETVPDVEPLATTRFEGLDGLRALIDCARRNSDLYEVAGWCDSRLATSGRSLVDDIGLLPVTTETAEALNRVVDDAYKKRSIALSSNLHPAGFEELMPKTIANATVDRLLHHAHVVMTTGDSIRLTLRPEAME